MKQENVIKNTAHCHDLTVLVDASDPEIWKKLTVIMAENMHLHVSTCKKMLMQTKWYKKYMKEKEEKERLEKEKAKNETHRRMERGTTAAHSKASHA